MESDRTGLRSQAEAYDLGRSDERFAQRAIYESIARALLIVEWGLPGDAGGDEAYCSACETCRVGRHPDHHRNGHDAGCPVDAALVALGFADPASRDAAREAIKKG